MHRALGSGMVNKQNARVRSKQHTECRGQETTMQRSVDKVQQKILPSTAFPRYSFFSGQISPPPIWNLLTRPGSSEWAQWQVVFQWLCHVTRAEVELRITSFDLNCCLYMRVPRCQELYLQGFRCMATVSTSCTEDAVRGLDPLYFLYFLHASGLQYCLTSLQLIFTPLLTFNALFGVVSMCGGGHFVMRKQSPAPISLWQAEQSAAQ